MSNLTTCSQFLSDTDIFRLLTVVVGENIGLLGSVSDAEKLHDFECGQFLSDSDIVRQIAIEEDGLIKLKMMKL